MDRSRAEREQPSVLLVDDDSATCAIHVERLRGQGYHVVKVGDPASAIDLARQTLPKIIFLSIGRSGSASSPFLQALRADDHTRHIPVIMLASPKDGGLERLGLQRVGREHL